MFASANGKEQKKVRQLQSSGTVYRSYPILPFGIVACTFFPTNFLEIAVNGDIFYRLTCMLMSKNNVNNDVNRYPPVL